MFSVPSEVTSVIMQWKTFPKELTNIEPSPGGIRSPVVVIGPVKVGNVPPVIVIVMVTGIGLLVFVLDTTALAVRIEEDGLAGETELSSFLHPVRIMNDTPIRCSIDFNCVFIIFSFRK